MGVALSERAIEASLIENLFLKQEGSYSFVDTQLVKKVLNQLKALNMLYSSWDASKSVLFWGLTPKGELERNKVCVKSNSV